MGAVEWKDNPDISSAVAAPVGGRAARDAATGPLGGVKGPIMGGQFQNSLKEVKSSHSTLTPGTMERAKEVKMRRGGALTMGVIALATTALASCAWTLEQVQLGQWYTIHTMPAGTCPGLDWHFVVDANRSMNGYIASAPLQPTATFSGTLNADDSFEMTATDVVTNRKAHVSGKFTSQFIAISIDGPGTVCDKQSFKIRMVRGLGLGGGGG